MLADVKLRLNAWVEALEKHTVDVIYGRRTGRGDRVYAVVLAGLSLIFRGLVIARYHLYQSRILRNHHLGCLVIVVGNLTVGGTGKTPVVEKLARLLTERGRRVAILSRGYKSRREGLWRKWWRFLTHGEAPPPKVVSDGHTVLLGAADAGDEPHMLARNLPGVVVLVDKDRVKAGRHAIRRYGADTLILDDGFQYFALKDHLQLLMVDKSNPFGNHWLLPRGILREPVEHLRRASYIFLTKSDGQPDAELESLIRRHKPGAELIECTHRPRYLCSVHGSERLELSHLRGKRVGAFCGIATPESFEGFVKAAGAEVVVSRWFLDHHWYQPRELDRFFRRAREAQVDWVITTEKDAVRIDAGYRPPLPFYYLRVEVDILRGAADFEAALQRMCDGGRSTTPTPWQ